MTLRVGIGVGAGAELIRVSAPLPAAYRLGCQGQLPPSLLPPRTFRVSSQLLLLSIQRRYGDPPIYLLKC